MNAPTNIQRTPRRRAHGLGLPLALFTALVLGVVALMVALSAVPTKAQEAPPSYTVTDLGIPPGYDYAFAGKVNEASQVVGYADTYSEYASDGWIWQDDGNPTTADFKEFSDLLGQDYGYAHGINDIGQVVGHGGNTNGLRSAW